MGAQSLVMGIFSRVESILRHRVRQMLESLSQPHLSMKMQMNGSMHVYLLALQNDYLGFFIFLVKKKTNTDKPKIFNFPKKLVCLWGF